MNTQQSNQQDKKKSRNALYEQKRKAETGHEKMTAWFPSEFRAEFIQMAEFCRNNKGYFPYMARSATTGRLAKAVD